MRLTGVTGPDLGPKEDQDKMDEEESSRQKKSKSKHTKMDSDYVDRQVSRAMKQVERAMDQVKMAEREAKAARKQGKHMRDNYQGPHMYTGFTSTPFAAEKPAQGATAFQNNTTTHCGTFINIQHAKNVQVGNSNTMIINKSSKKKKKKSRRKSDSDDEDISSDSDREKSAKKEREEVEKLPIFHSKRLVNGTDIGVVVTSISNWRRFLRFLTVEDGVIEQLYENHFHQGGVREILRQGINYWQRTANKNATIDVFAQALLKMDCASALRELEP